MDVCCQRCQFSKICLTLIFSESCCLCQKPEVLELRVSKYYFLCVVAIISKMSKQVLAFSFVYCCSYTEQAVTYDRFLFFSDIW